MKVDGRVYSLFMKPTGTLSNYAELGYYLLSDNEM